MLKAGPLFAFAEKLDPFKANADPKSSSWKHSHQRSL
jgi:hypothetical protein